MIIIKDLSSEEISDLFEILKKRFDENMNRHSNIKWNDIQEKLIKTANKLYSLYEMEKTGGEPDVIRYHKNTGEYVFCDCSKESPLGRIEDEIKYIDAKIPKFEYEGKTDLEKRVNQEISKIINEEIKNAENHAKEYYDAFVATGGNPKDFMPIGINIDYDIKNITEDVASFVINKSETFASAYFVEYFYNIDMESGRYLTLKDWLGNDYKEKAVQSIKNTISGWSQEQKELLFVGIILN